MRSRATVGQARDRLQKIAKRDDLYTNDPLMAEILLAQVTSNMAIAEAIQELNDSVRSLDESILYVGRNSQRPDPLKPKEEKLSIEKEQTAVYELLRNINKTLDSILQFLKTVSRKL